MLSLVITCLREEFVLDRDWPKDRLLEVDEFLRLLQEGRRALDVRSAGEFARGHVPGAENLPLLNDEERRAVGTTFARVGQQEAFAGTSKEP